MGQKITFGKWQGWDTDRLAKTGSVGRDYLEWGRAELKSPKWQQEFARALEENQVMDRTAMGAAMLQECPDLAAEIDQEIELELGRWEREREKTDKCRKLTNYFTRKLRELGITEDGIPHLVKYHGQIWHQVKTGQVKFATADANAVIDLCNRYGDAMYKVEFS